MQRQKKVYAVLLGARNAGPSVNERRKKEVRTEERKDPGKGQKRTLPVKRKKRNANTPRTGEKKR